MRFFINSSVISPGVWTARLFLLNSSSHQLHTLCEFMTSHRLYETQQRFKSSDIISSFFLFRSLSLPKEVEIESEDPREKVRFWTGVWIVIVVEGEAPHLADLKVWRRNNHLSPKFTPTTRITTLVSQPLSLVSRWPLFNFGVYVDPVVDTSDIQTEFTDMFVRFFI